MSEVFLSIMVIKYSYARLDRAAFGAQRMALAAGREVGARAEDPFTLR
jgi:hypothetical protein